MGRCASQLIGPLPLTSPGLRRCSGRRRRGQDLLQATIPQAKHQVEQTEGEGNLHPVRRVPTRFRLCRTSDPENANRLSVSLPRPEASQTQRTPPYYV